MARSPTPYLRPTILSLPAVPPVGCSPAGASCKSAPHDPNSIIGPKGSGTNPLVPPAQPLPYTVLFTNLATVNAPAQQVVVTEQLDPNLDWRTFRLSSFDFGGQTYAIPDNSSFYQTTIDLTQQLGLEVNFTATIDESTGIATWTFTTIDPTTGEIPLNPTVGLLPPDTSNGIGEGFVSYTIMAASSDPNGTLIGAQATVTFDTQPPLDTAKIYNTVSHVDTTPPITTDVLAGTKGSNGYYTSTTVHVTLTASDPTGDVAATYYILDGGSEQIYTGSAFSVSGEGTHHIAFWSVDAAGNTESAESDSFKIDSVAPTTTLGLAGTAGTDSWYTSSVTVTLTPSDATSGVAGTSYTLDGGAMQAYTGPFTVSGDAVHTLLFDSVDSAGNKEITRSQTIPIDTTAPMLALPSDQTFPASQSAGVLVNYVGATATDNLTTPTLTYSQDTGTVFPLGTTTVEVTATDAAGNQSMGSFTVTVELVRADRLSINTPLQAVATGQFSITVDATNSDGVTDPTYQGSVALSLSSGPTGGILSGVLTEPIVNGVATFSNLALSTAGIYTFLATSTSDLISATTSLNVVQAPKFSVTITPAVPGNTSAGQPFNVTVTAQLDGKTDTAYLGTVVLTSSDPQVASTTLTFLAGDVGSKTLTLTLETPGKQTVSVADTRLPSSKGTSNVVTVTGTLPLTIDHFTLTGFPASDVAGSAHTVTLTAVNAAGKTVTNYTGTVQVTSSDSAFKPLDVVFTSPVREC